METRNELLDAAREVGYKITGVQLANWHRAGLLPEPCQLSLGRPHGTQSVYPPGTKKQLLALCALRQNGRRLGHIAWYLWCDGYDIRPATIRDFMIEVAGDYDSAVKFLAKGHRFRRGLSDEAQELADVSGDYKKTRFSTAFIRRVRKRISTKKFPAFVELVCIVATGSFDGYSEDTNDKPGAYQKSPLERLLGLGETEPKSLFGVKPWLTVNPEEEFYSLSNLMADTSLVTVLKAASDAQLRHACEQVCVILNGIESLSSVAETLFGDTGFRHTLYGILGQARHELEADDQALLVASWIVFRNGGLADIADELVSAFQQRQETVLQACHTLLQLRHEVSALSEALSPKQMRAGFKGKKAWEDRQAQLSRLYETHKEDLDAFWRRHPEFGYTPKPKD